LVQSRYWGAIIGPGKTIDTNKYHVLSSDTLVNLNAKQPNVVTTGPATICARFPDLIRFRLWVNIPVELLPKRVDREPPRGQLRPWGIVGLCPGSSRKPMLM
jgi:hypothetical protein